MENRRERAEKYFCEGYNCAQAVLLAFATETGLDRETAARISSSFGGGMGRLREVCGAVSGMFMAAGLIFGYDDPAASEEKTAHYELVRELAAKFTERNGSIICRELLKNTAAGSGGTPAQRTPEYYATRPCARFVGDAAEILDGLIAKRG